MSSPKRMMYVAAAALQDGEKRVLLAQRPAHKPMAGLWEFPGGKLEVGEPPEAALVRELQEELGIVVDEAALEPIQFVSFAYPEFHLLMLLYGVRTWHGAMIAREQQQFAWVTAEQMADYTMPPADIPLLTALTRWMRGEERF